MILEGRACDVWKTKGVEFMCTRTTWRLHEKKVKKNQKVQCLTGQEDNEEGTHLESHRSLVPTPLSFEYPRP